MWRLAAERGTRRWRGAPASYPPRRMLLLAISLLWLAAAAFVVMLCRAAARSEAQLVREGRHPSTAAPTGLGLWEDPPELRAGDVREQPREVAVA